MDENKLKTARTNAGVTQQQLADASGVNIRQIRRVELGTSEAGNMSARNLLAIADILGVDPRNLIEK
ncbi:helix-turn-helix domain-containing protein [Evtepia sp.]|jgi:transcriptional regulator with XRE-family HTH domain|uniref:helix-turn-helix domain-containing protein n=1 Tax=Evtepia sp. TaxID=2773933 RepID=UPI003990B9DE